MLFCVGLGLLVGVFLSSSIYWITMLAFLTLICLSGIGTFVYLDLEIAWFWGVLSFFSVSIVVFIYKSIFFEKFKEINDEISDILNSVEEAIFTFNQDLSLNSEYSQKAGEYFDVNCFLEHKSISEVLKLDDEKHNLDF